MTAATDLSRDTVRAIEWDCSQVLLRFFYYLDERRYDDLADLFTPDGMWNRLGNELRGREQILAAMRGRSATMTVRHIATNILVDVVDESTATSVLYLTAYLHDSGVKPDKPPEIRWPYLLLVVTDRLVKTPRGWRIVEKMMKREFAFPAQP